MQGSDSSEEPWNLRQKKKDMKSEGDWWTVRKNWAQEVWVHEEVEKLP